MGELPEIAISRIGLGFDFFAPMSFESTGFFQDLRWSVRLLTATACMFLCALSSKACDEVPQGALLELRLLNAVSSYSSHPGDIVSATLTEDVICDGRIALPTGTNVVGTVVSVRKVGLGIRHETAALRLEFNQLVIGPDSVLPMKSRILEVYDARENIKNGVIQGVRGTDTPQGRISSRLKHLPTWNPYSDAGLIAFKLAFPIFPEPEIWYGPGTDLEVQLTAPLHTARLTTAPLSANDFTERELITLDDIASRLPARDSTADHTDADVINVVLIGSREDVEHAFVAAGWTRSVSFSKSAFLKEFHAYLNNSSYAEAPMRTMLLGHSPPDLLWQKSLNTYSKRDHLRAWHWQEDFDGTPVWIAATTHDVGATLSIRYKRFVHHIAPNIDQERAKVIRDLKFAGCVDSVYLAQRPEVLSISQNATGDPIRTDSAVAFVRLKECDAQTRATPKEFHAGSRPFRYARQQILTFRSDIWRANIFYGAFDLGRVLRSAFRRPDRQSVDSPATKVTPEGPEQGNCPAYLFRPVT